MKVAILSPYPTLPFQDELRCRSVDAGSNATWTVALAEHLARIPNTEVHVITESTVIPRTQIIRRGALHVHFIRAPEKLKTVSLWQFDRRRLLRILDEIQPDIVHGEGIENQYGYIAVTSGRPSVLTIHGIPKLSNESRQVGTFSRLRVVEVFARYCLRRANNIIVINPFIAEYLRLDPQRYRLFHIANPVAAHFFGVTRTKRESGLVLAIGSLDRLKAQDVLLRALAILRRRGVKARCIIVGPKADDEYFESLQSYIFDEKLEVEFTGFIPPETVANLLGRCAVLAHPSRHDNAPMSVCEAMAAGVPVVASRVGGIPHVIEDGVTGLLFESENAEQFADKLQALLQDPATGARLGENARNHMLASYAPDRVAQLTRQAYEKVLQETGRTNGAPPTFLQRHKRAIKQVASVVPVFWRQLPVYWEWRWFLEKAQFWPAERMAAWQLTRLQKMVQYAFENTPGYRQLYEEAGVQPKDIRSLADLQQLPFTTKELFQNNLEDFSVRRRGRRYVTTGGSTGIPFGFYLMQANESIESAFMHTFWQRVGWQLGGRSAILRGGYIGTPEQPWQYDPYWEDLLLSSYQLTDKTLPAYLDVMRQRDIHTLQAYPSSLHLMCRLMEEAKISNPIPLRLVLLGSENVYDWQLELFQRVFPQARLFAWYGHAERVILAPWCERSRQFHAWPLYGITEVLGANDQPVAPGTEGELVGTSFHNFVTPFIRYRTMDRAVLGASDCPACGRHFQLLESISGRSHEMIVTATGRHISMTAINMHDRTFDALRQFQFYQDTPGRVLFKYVAKNPLDVLDLEQIRQVLRKKLGTDTELTLAAVEEIPRTASGKYRFLDQRLKIKYGDRPA